MSCNWVVLISKFPNFLDLQITHSVTKSGCQCLSAPYLSIISFDVKLCVKSIVWDCFDPHLSIQRRSSPRQV